MSPTAQQIWWSSKTIAAIQNYTFLKDRQLQSFWIMATAKVWRGRNHGRNHGNRGTDLAVRVQIKGSKRIAQGNKENPTHIFHWAKWGSAVWTHEWSLTVRRKVMGGGGWLHRDARCLGVVVRLASRQMTAKAFMSSIRASVSRGINTQQCVLSSIWVVLLSSHLCVLPSTSGPLFILFGYLSKTRTKVGKVSPRYGLTQYLGCKISRPPAGNTQVLT